MEQTEALALARAELNLQEALRRGQEDPDRKFLLPLRQLPQDDGSNNVGEALDLERGGQNALRIVMCQQLYRAAFSGDADELLGYFVLPDAGQLRAPEATAGGNTVLHIAAARGHVALVTRLFQAAPADAATLLVRRNSKSEAALHLAARAGHHEMVSLLIMLAQEANYGPGAAQLLLSKDTGGDTVLHVAARHGRQTVAEMLVKVAPALSCAVNTAGASPLYLAVISRSVGSVRALVQCMDPVASASGPNRKNALHAAVLQSAEITQEILTWNENLNLNLVKESDESRSTPVHYAVCDGDNEIISKLISPVPLRSALCLQDEQGFTPLHIAAWMGHVNVIHDILQVCPDSAEVTDNNGRNFLHVAIERGHESVVKYIIGSPFAGGLMNEQDNHGNTPLHSAVVAILENELLELNIVKNEGRRRPLFDLLFDITRFLPMVMHQLGM